MPLTPPFSLIAWIGKHRAELEPPVGNKLLFEGGGLIVMAVGGPNSRKDFHHDPHEEFFYQIEGDLLLKTVQDHRMVDVPVRAGEVFVLPAHIPHSPRRPAGSVGLVVERRREPHELDGFSWYCERCGHLLHLEQVHISDIERQLAPIFAGFYASLRHRTCRVCGTVMQPPVAPPAPGTVTC